MDNDDDGPRAPRAGRRAAKKFESNNWGDSEPVSGQGGPSGEGFGGGESQNIPDYAQTLPERQDTQELDYSSGQGSRAPPAASGSWQSNPDPLSGESSKRFAGISRRKQEQLSRGDEETVRKNQRYEEATGGGAEAILDIPELEDEGREDLSNVVAAAPKIRTNKVQGMNELDDDMHFKLPSMDDRDIDLSLLTAVLCASEQVQEGDELWDPEILLTEVASAVNTEREKAEAPDADGKDLDGSQKLL